MTKRAISVAILFSALLMTTTTVALAFEPIISMPGPDREIHPAGVTDEVLATKAQTNGQLGMILLDNPVGGGPGPSITNTKAADYWYVIDGTYEFHVGDKVFEGGPGTLLAVDIGTSHGYITKSAGHILSIFAPGGYEQFFVEWSKSGLQPGPELGKLEEKFGVTRPAP